MIKRGQVLNLLGCPLLQPMHHRKTHKYSRQHLVTDHTQIHRYLRMSYHGQAIEGPVMFISAGIHGNEVIARGNRSAAVADQINIKSLRGTLIWLCPDCKHLYQDFSAYIRGICPTRRDLNRCHSPASVLMVLWAQRLAHY